MKFQLPILVLGLAFAAAASNADAQVANQNGAARGPNTSFYFGRNIPNAARSDPVNAPGVNANPMARPTARFGVVGQTPVTRTKDVWMSSAGPTSRVAAVSILNFGVGVHV